MPATVLVLVETINDYLPILEHQGFHLILAPTPAERAQAIASHGPRIDAVLTRGPLGLTAEEIAALPALKIITVIGAGYEHVDLQAASDRGITVTNGAGVNASSVADHAMALLLALVRDIPRCDAAVRRGEWPKIMRPSLANKRLGILGLGAVGMAIAKRAQLGFDMQISYHNRQLRSDVPYAFCSTPTELARVDNGRVIPLRMGDGFIVMLASRPAPSRRMAQRSRCCQGGGGSFRCGCDRRSSRSRVMPARCGSCSAWLYRLPTMAFGL